MAGNGLLQFPGGQSDRILAGYEPNGYTQKRKKLIPAVIELRPKLIKQGKKIVQSKGYSSTVRRDMERRMAAELAEAKRLGLQQIGCYLMPGLKWPIKRPVFHAPGMSRRSFKVISPSVLLHKWEREYELLTITVIQSDVA